MSRQRFMKVSRRGQGGLVGYLDCSYADLHRAFGEPGNCDMDKTSTEWVIDDLELGERFSIYDYCQVDPSDTDEVAAFRARATYRWHIGGMEIPDLDALEAFIKGQ